jgi:tRNA threonylcarbamoyladenosine biosynthesis protein TsaE
MITEIAQNENDLPFIAKLLLEHLGTRKVVAFYGEMGAGKTTFISALLRAMGITEIDGSPTYGFVQTYESPMYGTVHHFDMYRINNVEEAFDIGFEEYIYSDAYSFIEWPSNVAELLPDDIVEVSISLNSEGDRVFQW